MITHINVYVTSRNLFLGSSQHHLRLDDIWDYFEAYSHTHALIINNCLINKSDCA